jgi:peroxiredoxin
MTPNPATWLPGTLRLAGLSILFSALYAVATHGWNAREIIDDMALGAFGVAVIAVAPRALQAWGLFLFGTAMSATLLIAGALEWWHRAGLVVCLMAFTWVLIEAYCSFIGCQRVVSPAVQKLALRTKTQYGVSLDELSKLTPVLLVFLRQTGCTFCRETLHDLSHQRPAIEAEGVRIVVVFMAVEEKAGQVLSRFGLEDINRVSDPHQHVYRAFGLARGRLMALVGPRELWRGFLGLLKGFGWAPPAQEDGFQMPGVFLLFHGEVLRSYRHQSAAERPDYLAIVQGDGLSEFSARS